MKRILALAVLAIAASPLASGQTVPEKPVAQEKPVGQKVAAGANVEEEVMQLEQKLTDALLKGDRATFGSHLADNVTLTDPSGTVNAKAQFEADVKSGALKLESSKIDDMKVQAHGDVATGHQRRLPMD